MNLEQCVTCGSPDLTDNIKSHVFYLTNRISFFFKENEETLLILKYVQNK
jgi:hypothetical protein